MALSRRAILMGGGAAVLVSGGAIGWDLSRIAKKAREPWAEAADGFGDPRLDALAFAILAPNPHNMQPWLIRLDDALSFTVFCAPDRLLPETDPPNRQITIGFGCFLELLAQAAAEKGHRTDITLFPQGEGGARLDTRLPMASVTLTPDPGAAKDPLFAQALKRRTIRTPFDMNRPVSYTVLSEITAAALPGLSLGVTNDPMRLDRLRTITSEAWKIEWSTPRTRRESLDVTRIGRKEINDDPDGIALEGPVIEAMHRLGLLTREKSDDPNSAAYEQSEAFYLNACQSAMGFLWGITATNSRAEQIETGRSWVRLHQAATAAGLAFHPLSQCLQEFPEMTRLYGDIHRELGAEGPQTVQMLIRLGYVSGTSRPTPRHPLISRIVEI